MQNDKMSPHQAFGLLIFLIALLGCFGVMGGLDCNTLNMKQGLYAIIAILIIMIVGVLIINYYPAEDKLHKSNKKARQVGKPNRANEKL